MGRSRIQRSMEQYIFGTAATTRPCGTSLARHVREFVSFSQEHLALRRCSLPRKLFHCTRAQLRLSDTVFAIRINHPSILKVNYEKQTEIAAKTRGRVRAHEGGVQPTKYWINNWASVIV